MSTPPAVSGSEHLQILVVEDSVDHTALVQRAFKSSPLPTELICVATLADARRSLAARPADVVLADMRLPDGTGTELLGTSDGALPLVLMTSFGDEAQAVSAMKAGALDYVVKHENIFADLPAVCLRAARNWQARQAEERARLALIASENRYRMLFENVPAGIFQCDLQGQIIVANAALSDILGYAADQDLVGLGLLDELLAEVPVATRSLKALVDGGNLEVRLRRADSGSAIGMLTLQPVIEDGCLCCYEGFLLDLTKQRAADAELAETRLRFESAFRNIVGFIAFVDEQGRVLDVNDSALSATAVSREEIVGISFTEAPWWADIEGESEAIRAGLEAARAGHTTRDQGRFRVADGQVRYADRSFTPVLDDSGLLKFIVVEGRDISDLVEASRKLQQREAEFRNLFENASEAIVVLDMESNAFIDLNRNAEMLFNAPKEQLLGRNPLELSPAIQPNRELSAEVAQRRLQQAVAGQLVVFEWVHKTVDGREIPCEVRLSRLPHPQKVLVRGSITDISARKSAEIRLRNQQQRMSALVENATSGILEIDADGAVLSANPAAIGMLGHNQAAELAGQRFVAHVAQSERSNVLTALEAAWGGNDTSRIFPLVEEAGERMIAASFVAIRAADGAIARVMLMCDDITERYAHARQIEEEQRFTNAVINSLPGTFYVYAENGELIRYNDRFLKSSGYSADEVQTMSPLDFFQGDDKANVAAAVRELFSGGESQVEARLTSKDGTRVPYAFTGCLLEQHGRRFMVGVGLDITERVRNEERVQAEKRFSETVINSMPGIFYVVNEQRKVVRWNQNLLAIMGVEASEVAGLDPMSRIAPKDRKQVAATLNKVFSSGAAETEAGFVTADGSEAAFLLTGRRLRLRDQNFMIGMGFDISARKRYEAQLRASEIYLRSIVESEPECVWTLSRDGRLVDINPAGRTLLGDRTVAYLQHEPVATLVQPQQRRAFEQLNDSVFAGHSGILTFEIETRDGVKRWLETHAVALRNERGEINGHLAVTRDITAKRKADRKIREYSDRLQSLSQRLLEIQESERRHLARELHDEVGQSLTALKLDLEATRGDGAREHSYLLESVQIVDRILAQVRDLSLDLRPAILDDLGLMPALRWYVDRQGKRGGLATRVDSDSLTGVRLAGAVETAAFRIVQEALTNAIRHAGAKSVDIRLRIEGERLLIKIKDDGCGFDAEHKFRGASHGESFGLLGLQERASLLGGNAKIESSPGEGSTVSAWLPLEGSPAEVDVARTG